MAKELIFYIGRCTKGDLKLKCGPFNQRLYKTEERSRNKDDSIRNIM